MEKISKDEVKHLAKLSNISLSEDEAASLQGDLANIVAYIEQLDELNTDGVEPTYSVSKNQNVWREDEIDDYGVGKVELLALAGENMQDGQVKVPKVL
ncbi:MAG: Asp-tRNA(Asn)/Glu-tRNA(Gln) amidotransferase subunit GatC [bacterium]|nr:Asp-tRNA(Asn)/Glu-tRNA(Gln) amidotransferase subunit GatC [bacterium]